MCISMATAALIGAGASAVGTIASIDNARRSRNHASDAARAAAETEARAAQSSNATLAARRRAMKANSLTTDASTGMASAGRATLGGQ